MIPALRHWIKQRLRGIGVDIQRLHVASDPGLQLVQAMRHFGIDLVLDVGANRGQFAQELRANGFREHIVSFEPLSAAHTELVAAAAKDPAWRVHERVALGHPMDRSSSTSRATPQAAPCLRCWAYIVTLPRGQATWGGRTSRSGVWTRLHLPIWVGEKNPAENRCSGLSAASV